MYANKTAPISNKPSSHSRGLQAGCVDFPGLGWDGRDAAFLAALTADFFRGRSSEVGVIAGGPPGFMVSWRRNWQAHNGDLNPVSSTLIEKAKNRLSGEGFE